MNNEKICYRKLTRYKYQLLEPFLYQIAFRPQEDIITDFVKLDILGNLTLSANYAWDGPSGPTLDTKNFMRGSLVHDALYQLIREKYLERNLQDFADRLLQEMCKQDGMNSFRAWYVYKAVSFFGKFSLAKSRKKEQKPIYAP